MKDKLLVTGASGNIGRELIKHLLRLKVQPFEIVAGVRNSKTPSKHLVNYKGIQFVTFDFENPNSFGEALKDVKTVFLLRPPALADIEKVFVPLINALEKRGVKEVLFLSVQGADKIKMIPHHKIEQLLIKSKLSYIFLRPSYFMQNLNTTLLQDIVEDTRIYLPAGNALFNWVDAENIGEVAALFIIEFDKYKNKGFDLTGSELENFEHVANLLSKEIDKPIKYKSPNLISFFLKKRKQGHPIPMIFVMILLHFLPRFSKPTTLSDNYTKLTGKKPTQLVDFIHRERNSWL